VRMRGLHGAIPITLLGIIAAAGYASAATPLSDYSARLGRAAAAVDSLLDDGTKTPEDQKILAVLDSVKRLMRPTEEIAFGEQTVHVDNAWLHDAIARLSRQYRSHEGTADERYSALIAFAERIMPLAERVHAALDAPRVDPANQRALLEGILAQSDFQTDSQKESTLQRWIARAWRAFVHFLLRIFASRSESVPKPGNASLNVVRVLIAIGLVAALVIGGVWLARRLRRRVRREKKREVREVRGEEIAEGTTTEDLLAKAAELSRSGDYRGAIRRAYIALLCELEQRGKLRLARAKTNRDYMNEIRSDLVTYEPVLRLTNTFERVWYGERSATKEDYTDFMGGWSVVGGRWPVIGDQ